MNRCENLYWKRMELLRWVDTNSEKLDEAGLLSSVAYLAGLQDADDACEPCISPPPLEEERERARELMEDIILEVLNPDGDLFTSWVMKIDREDEFIQRIISFKGAEST